MGELFRDIGLKAIEFLPFTLGIAAAVIAFAIWGAIHAHEHNDRGQLWFCGGVIVVTAALLPWAYASTKEFCTNMAATYAVTTDTGITGARSTFYPGYVTSKCHSVWPNPADLSS